MKADIVKFRDVVIETAGLEQDSVTKFLVYGELMCNKFYDCDIREFVGSWPGFGTVLEFKKDFQMCVDIIRKSLFAGTPKLIKVLEMNIRRL